jgi:L-fucose mutarotase/ribose pyranase (RbsD/FucU family)
MFHVIHAQIIHVKMVVNALIQVVTLNAYVQKITLVNIVKYLNIHQHLQQQQQQVILIIFHTI